jgi:hypothetical protein
MCFVCISNVSVAVRYSHLQTIVQQECSRFFLPYRRDGEAQDSADAFVDGVGRSLPAVTRAIANPFVRDRVNPSAESAQLGESQSSR